LPDVEVEPETQLRVFSLVRLALHCLTLSKLET